MRWLFALIALCSACGGVTKFTTVRRTPAAIDIPAGSTMTIAPVTGEGGDRLTAELTAAVNATRRFKIVPTGAATLVAGQIVASEYKEDVRTDTKQCNDRGVQVDCSEFVRDAKAAFGLIVRVTETSSGRALTAKRLDTAARKSARAAGTHPPAIGAKDEMLATCRQDVIKRFVGSIAPHEIEVTVSLRIDDALPELEQGVAHARVGDWAKAINRFTEATGKGSSPQLQAAAEYDLGVAYAYAGAYREAIARLQKAITLDPRDMYGEQLEIIRGYERDASKLVEQEK